MKDFNKRLLELERQIKSAGESPVWISGTNATIRVDINHRRGNEVTFPSIYEARLWLEKQIDTHAGGIIDYVVDNICDLHEDAPMLRNVVKDIIPEPIIVPQRSGVVIGGQIQPLVFDADNHFSGILALGGIAPGMKADLRLWCLANLISQYFDNSQFKERWKSQQITDGDNRMMLATIAVYAWHNPGSKEEILAGWAELFYQVTDLPALEYTEQLTGAESEEEKA